MASLAAKQRIQPFHHGEIACVARLLYGGEELRTTHELCRRDAVQRNIGDAGEPRPVDDAVGKWGTGEVHAHLKSGSGGDAQRGAGLQHLLDTGHRIMVHNTHRLQSRALSMPGSG